MMSLICRAGCGAPYLAGCATHCLVYLIDYLCTYILMVHFCNSLSYPSLHSHTLVHLRPPSKAIVAHLWPLQPPHPHLTVPHQSTLHSHSSHLIRSSPRPAILIATLSPTSPIQLLSTMTSNPSCNQHHCGLIPLHTCSTNCQHYPLPLLFHIEPLAT